MSRSTSSTGRNKTRTSTEATASSATQGDAKTTSRTKRTGSKSSHADQESADQARTEQADAAPDSPQESSQASSSSSDSTLWRRLVAAVRGGVSELGEAIADSQALRILDQEIRDNDAELHRVRASLAETLARYKVALDKVAATMRKLEEYEGYAMKALGSGEDALAREVAAKIALLEIERDGEAKRAEDFAEGIANLRKVVVQYEATIKRLKQQVDTVRATESVQRAQATVASRREESDTRVRTALDSLERIKRRQLERGAHLEAAESVMAEDSGFEARLRRAGIIVAEDRTESVLDRLKKQADDK